MSYKTNDDLFPTNYTSSENASANIFDEPISMKPPLSLFTRREHPVKFPPNLNHSPGKPVDTNKFYGNLLLGNQTLPVWTHPYSVWYSKETFFGLAVSHIRASQRAFGPDIPPRFFFSPTGIKSFIFSSIEFKSPEDIQFHLFNLKNLSCNVFMKQSEDKFIDFPLVQGMGFVTAIYHRLVPVLNSAVGVKTFMVSGIIGENIRKYEIQLEDNTIWCLYVTISKGVDFNLKLINGNTIVCDRMVDSCVFQLVADKKPEIDLAAGCYPIECKLFGSTSESKGFYSLSYITDGTSLNKTTLMYALPHHIKNFTKDMESRETSSYLDSTVSGAMRGYLTNDFHIQVEIPNNLEFDPFSTISGKTNPKYLPEVLDSIRESAIAEINTSNILEESNLDSMYFSGKILAKYAWILYSVHYVLKDKDLTLNLLQKLKDAISRFTNNRQIFPLIYDLTWKGIISSGSSSQDFGNAFYNDHHFHYGYHIIASAILARVDNEIGDSSWLDANRDWVENILRDYANPSSSDPFFPVFRSFDWFNGHSWAKGLFESGDGKDEESSSEDVNSAYALKLWGIVTNNPNLTSIGDLMLGVLKTSLNHYFLYVDNNTTEPAIFIPNKVSGILFENKIDHATYFGLNPEFIHMIHAIPITPASSFIRSPTFVKEEWEEKLKGITNRVVDGWRGVLMLNLALFDPTSSYLFFNSSAFQNSYLDNGQSKTWSLTYSGAFS